LNLLIVGLGNIGSRHFEAALKSKYVKNIFLFDKNKNAIKQPNINNETVVNVLDNLDELPKTIDSLIIATSSHGREDLIYNLFNQIEFEFVIIEKVLFQSVKSYDEVSKFFERFNSKIYVNCPARMMHSYLSLRQQLKTENILEFRVTGGNWALASNSIHFLDTIDFLSKKKVSKFTIESELEYGEFFNKREGYIEFYGKIFGSISEIDFSLECNHSNDPYLIEIFTKNYNFLIEESENRITCLDKSNNIVYERDFFIEYVSDTTTKVINSFYVNEKDLLINFESSSVYQKELIRLFLRHLNKTSKEEIYVCPIT